MIKKSLILMAVLSLLIVPLISQGEGQDFGKGRNGKGKGGFDGGMGNLLEDRPYQDVDKKEVSGLIMMREEEKLARDVYLHLFRIWRHRIFRNIARSEQRHMDAIKVLLDKYDLEDPVGGNAEGVFVDPQMQNLFFQLTSEGEVSLLGALQVGAVVEDLDIFDLKQWLDRTDNTDIKILYQNLMKGSRNHLRAFARQLKRSGISYSAHYLTQEEVDEIINSPMERGLYDENGEPVIGGLERVSKPGRRSYSKSDRIPHTMGGLGVNILSTSKGVMTDKEARNKGVGGEVLCSVW